MDFHLIQRATIQPRERKGLDGIIELDYMGSAEFEFGDVPRSLKRIREGLASYEAKDFDPIPQNSLTVFCKQEQRADIENFLRKCCEGQEHKFRLKERT